jgi:hypothetical protein
METYTIITETEQKEIKITFPCSFNYLNSVYYHFINHVSGVAVYGTRSISNVYIETVTSWENMIPCDKSEVEEAFNKVVNNLKNKLK